MSKDMLGIAVRKLVTLPADVLGTVCDLLEKLADPEWVAALKRFLRKENPWLEPPLLKLEKTITTLAMTAKPAAIAAGATVNGVKVLYTNPEFDQLRDSFGDEELSSPAGTLRVHVLERDSPDEPILKELGGEKSAEINLAGVLAVMEQMQSSTDIWFVCYIRDKKGRVWGVRCYWGSGDRYWGFLAYSATDPSEWDRGDRLVSR